MQTDKPHFVLSELIALLPPRGHELLMGVSDPSLLADTLPITGARVLELANETELVFCKNGSDILVNLLMRTRSRFVVVDHDVYASLPEDFVRHRVFLFTSQPRLFLAMLLMPFEHIPAIVAQQDAIHPSAQVASNVILGRGVVIGPSVIIHSDCVIGPNTVIDHATIGAGTRIGSNCTIGGDGFGFEIDKITGDVVKFPHLGSVQIGERVEIAANVTIDRGSLRDTVLWDEVKVDNLVYIAHNCHVKRGALVMAHSALLGSVTIGEYAWIAPSTSILNGLTVGRCGMTGIGSVVVQSVGSNELVAGSPARKLRNRLSKDSPLLRDSDVVKDGSANNEGIER